MAITARTVWPIDTYSPDRPIVRQSLADNVDDPQDPHAVEALTDFVNAHDPRVIRRGVTGQRGGLDTVVAITVPSIEGDVDYHYLASLT